MRKFYPYLQNPYNRDLNDARDTDNFFKSIDEIVNQRQYIKITLLTWNEEPIKEIQGIVVGGSMTKDGSSSVRRTGSLNVSVDGGSYSPEDAEMDFAIKNKIFLEIGIKNDTDRYKEYPILWFPQGIFFINSFSATSSSTSAVNLSIGIRDKMSMLNGDVGGTIPATTIFDEVDTQLPSGEHVSKKVLIYSIIEEAVAHFGGEDLNNIIIEDIDMKIRRVVKWIGDSPLYLIQSISPVSRKTYYEPRLEKPDDPQIKYIQINSGDDCGYVYDDFTYIGELTATAGESVTSVLDKIVSYLGNYEYFYDEYGIFHFREIKNYINTTHAKTVLDSMSKNDYMVDTTVGKNSYAFSDNSNIISLSVSPQYSNIKNDYIIQGLRKMTNSDVSYDVRYHLAIDRKPEKTFEVKKDGFSVFVYEPVGNFLLYEEEGTLDVKGIFPYKVDSLPEVGNFNIVYATPDNRFVYWKDERYVDVKVVKYYDGKGDKSNVTQSNSSWYVPKDWRTELYVQGLLAKNGGTDPGYYFAELESGWPSIYDLENQKFYGEDSENKMYTSYLTDGNFFLDFIDPLESQLGKYSVDSIGRRSDVVINQDINCLFAPSIPDVVFIDNGSETANEDMDELEVKGEVYAKMKPHMYAALATGGYKNSAFDQVKYELYMHTNYQSSVNISAIPMYYIEPNVRASVSDSSTNTYGDYIVKTVSYTFGQNPSMSVTASEVFERF